MTGPQPPPERGRRRAKRKDPRQSWLPPWLTPGKKPRQPFMTRPPEHSETGVIYRPRVNRELLLKQGIDPDKAPKRRKKRLVSRTFFAFVMRWRRGVSAMTALFMMGSLVAGVLVLSRDAGLNSTTLPTQTAPTLLELNASIALGQRYIESLYKPISNGQAVQSEASGVPLRAHFLNENQWILLGEDQGPKTALLNVHDSATSDDYSASFDAPTKRAALTVRVQINWTLNATQFQIQTTPTSVKEPVELWLDTTPLAAYQPGDTTTTTHALNDSDQSQLRMLRFTVRHATQEAYLYWSSYGRDPTKAAALKKFLEANHYTAGFDLRAPLYNQNDSLPDDLPVNDKTYPDCDHIAAGDQFAYAYRSKVCLYESLYIASGERDPFLQAWDALTVLMKYKDPNHHQPENGEWTQGDTPTDVSTHLRGQWNRTGWGVPKCTPFSCAELSGIRTSVFGALQTQLGYVYGDKSAQRFADAAAKVITMAQVKADGKIRVDNGITYTRPAQVGAFLGAWTAKDLKFTQPSTPKLPVAIALLLRGAHSTPLEYQGLVPSNSETSLDALAFLEMYRCQRYHQGC